MTNLRFNGNGAEYFKIWIVNVLLTIVTIGLYYPWAKVRTRRYFYGNTSLDQQNFEYHATGKQLFLSYLIAMFFLIVYVVLGQVSPTISAIIMLLFAVAIPWIIWRSLIFNMKVSSFANVRFKFEGTLGDAYKLYIGYPLLFVVVAAVVMLVTREWSILLLIPLYVFAYALFKKMITEYRINGSRYGHGTFNCNLEIGPFVIISLKTFGVGVLATLIYFLLVSAIGGMTVFSNLAVLAENPDAIEQNASALIALVFVMYGGFFFIGMLTYAYATSRYRAYIYQNTKLEETILFNSTLMARTLAWVLFSNLVLLIVTLGLAFPWTKVRMAKAILENTGVKTDESLSDYTSQAQQTQSALGEELGDAFDVDVGLAL